MDRVDPVIPLNFQNAKGNIDKLGKIITMHIPMCRNSEVIPAIASTGLNEQHRLQDIPSF